jgi:hypothetical protein
MQTQKEQELAKQRVTEENQLATAVLSKYAKEQRERGEIADLHARHDVLRECAPLPLRIRTHNRLAG